ncbi:hypothetical protein ACIQUS_20645 [Pseudomonas sp. NPDC090755]|uniref:hypothetical protein n=1 Tax=Pseudomonas sp. NPDC090755 TaxID=3364481 RepID=UPI00383B12D5
MDKALLEKVEKLVDEKYLSLDLPHLDWTLVAWYLLTAFEDHQIWMFRIAAKDESQNRKLEGLVDRLKYSIKYALLRAKTEVKTDSNHEVPRRTSDILCRRAIAIIQEGMKYSAAMQIISSVYGKKVDLKQVDNAIQLEVIDDVYHDSSYSVLEVIGHIEPGVITYSLILLSWIKATDDLPSVVRLIAETVKLKNRVLRYDYLPHLAHQLALVLCQQPFLIPDGWIFEWGGRQETTLLLNALAIRCMYHLTAVEFGARRYKLKGGGDESLVLVLSREQLISDLIEMSSIDESAVGSFVDRLAFGNQVDAPDLALQPFIKLAGGKLALPCIHIISSHLERNLLTLQARQEPKRFNAQSGLFEDKMVEDLLAKVGTKWPLHRANVHVALGRVTEELDLVLVDPQSKMVFIGELRWMLPPGDPREVTNRKNVCGEKVVQLRRKYNAVKKHLTDLLQNVFAIQSDDSWEVCGAVIIEGFGGARSADDDLPVLVKYIAEVGLEGSDSLRQFAAWSTSLEWLPQEDVHFDRGHDRIETSAETIEYSTFGTICAPYEYRQFLADTLKRFASQPEQLEQSVPA